MGISNGSLWGREARWKLHLFREGVNRNGLQLLTSYWIWKSFVCLNENRSEQAKLFTKGGTPGSTSEPYHGLLHFQSVPVAFQLLDHCCPRWGLVVQEEGMHHQLQVWWDVDAWQEWHRKWCYLGFAFFFFYVFSVFLACEFGALY